MTYTHTMLPPKNKNKNSTCNNPFGSSPPWLLRFTRVPGALELHEIKQNRSKWHNRMASLGTTALPSETFGPMPAICWPGLAGNNTSRGIALPIAVKCRAHVRDFPCPKGFPSLHPGKLVTGIGCSLGGRDRKHTHTCMPRWRFVTCLNSVHSSSCNSSTAIYNANGMSSFRPMRTLPCDTTPRRHEIP